MSIKMAYSLFPTLAFHKLSQLFADCSVSPFSLETLRSMACRAERWLIGLRR